ncbi:hypothetical protein HPB47_001394 [Ixodes persulcatus]|uniref:Uncharacterized protein n=1 Tax=Ixodes persulcatus TaxID=34615 RepID=A0AC60PP48_IXOPE|nr:hypothetical protein HPB47_001394 [Ixodes persulcatus]
MCMNSVFLHANLTGRPYTAVDFRDGLKEIVDGSDVVSLGQYQMSHVWMLTLTSKAATEKVKAAGSLKVKGRVSLATPALNRGVVLTLHDAVTSADLPHMLKVYGVQSLLLVHGRPPLCLGCSSEEDTNQEHFMDVSEVVDAAGEVLSTAQAESTPPTPASTSTTNNTPDADACTSPTSKEQQQKAALPKDSSARPNREDRRDCDQMDTSAADANAPKEENEGEESKFYLPPPPHAHLLHFYCCAGASSKASMSSSYRSTMTERFYEASAAMGASLKS